MVVVVAMAAQGMGGLGGVCFFLPLFTPSSLEPSQSALASRGFFQPREHAEPACCLLFVFYLDSSLVVAWLTFIQVWDQFLLTWNAASQDPCQSLPSICHSLRIHNSHCFLPGCSNSCALTHPLSVCLHPNSTSFWVDIGTASRGQLCACEAHIFYWCRRSFC